MSKAIRVHAVGGPEVLRYEDVPTPEPGAGEVLLRHEAIGLNYIDVYFRTGLYKAPNLPVIIGQEGAGVIEELGPGVTEFAVGDRVAYAGALGAYAQRRVLPADRLVALPPEIDTRTGAGMMLQGLTAQYLLHRTYRVKRGDTILVHAAAGGVGLLLCQWAAHLGATVIGVVSTAEKAALAQKNGATHTVLASQNLAAEVKRLTGGEMLPVVYDSVGRETFNASLDCLAPLGLMVSYGNASGAVPPFDLSVLNARGSLFLTRPSLSTYIARPADLQRVACDLIEVVRTGAVRINIHQSFALSDAADAHRALEERRTTGKTILVP